MSSSVRLRAASGLGEWLETTRSSLILALRSPDSLLFISPTKDQQIRDVARQFEDPTSLHVTSDRLVLATDYQILELVNPLRGKSTYQGYDHIYIPRRTHTTGPIGARDLFQTDDGEVYFLSTQYRTLATRSDTHSFRPVPQTSFSPDNRSEASFCPTGITPNTEGRPHLGTVIRLHEADDSDSNIDSAPGTVVDLDTDTVVARGLAAPHSPRLDEETLYFLTAGNRTLQRMDLTNGTAEAVASLPSYPRSLTLHGGCAVVALSSRPDGLFATGAAGKDEESLRAGIHVIELATGRTVAEAAFEGEKALEICDVQVLPAARRPTTLEPGTEELRRTVVFETSEGAVYHRVPSARTPTRPEQEQKKKADPPTISSSELDFSEAEKQGTRVSGIQRYSFFAGQMAAEQVANRFSQLLPDRFLRRVRSGAIDASLPLTGVAATLDKKPVGISLMASPTDADVATAHALKVLPPHRGQGLGTALLERLEHLAKKAGAEVLQGRFRSSLPSLPALERVLAKQEWAPPKVTRYLYKGERSAVPKRFINHLSQDPSAGTLFEWSDLTATERHDLRARLNPSSEHPIPSSLNPLQMESLIELSCSVGLRHKDRVAGWMITHRLSTDVLQYTCLYVEPALRGPGVGLTLLAEAIRRQAEHTQIPRFVWMVDADRTRMKHVIDSRLADVIDKQDKLLLAAKQLSA